MSRYLLSALVAGEAERGRLSDWRRMMSMLSLALRARASDARSCRDESRAAAFQLAAERLEHVEYEIAVERDSARRMAAQAALLLQRTGAITSASRDWTRRADALDEALCLLQDSH
jgi:hypothetical protein